MDNNLKVLIKKWWLLILFSWFIASYFRVILNVLYILLYECFFDRPRWQPSWWSHAVLQQTCFWNDSPVFCKLNTVCVSVKFPAKQYSVSVTLHTAGSQQVKKTYFNVHSHVIFFFSCDHYLLHLDAAVTTELKKHIICWHIKKQNKKPPQK